MHWRIPILIATLLTLGACDWLQGSVKPPLPGERTAVLTVDRKLEPDERLRDTEVKLPEAADIQQWPLPQGQPGRTISNVLVDGFKYAWRASIGAGNSRSGRVTGSPVVADGRLFAVDAGSRLTAIDIARGSQVWSFDGEPEEDRSGGGSGGGAAVDGDKVYFATGYGQLVALEAKSGKELWRFQMGAPARSGPAVANGRIFVSTIDNQTHAVDASTGKRIWQHTGISESAGFVGAASPVIDGTTLLVGYSSGELFALRAESGRVLWSDTLSGVIRTGQVSGMADIRGRPAVDRGMAFVSTQSPETVAAGFALGRRLGKIAVRAGVCDGFIGNRILSAYRKQAEYLMEDGAAPAEIDAAFRDFGLPMGVFEMQDMAGLDIVWANRKALAPRRDPHERYVRIVDLICESGRFGRKTGSGYYNYAGKTPMPDEATLAIITQERRRRNIAPRTFSKDEIMDRILLAMINEGARILDEGIALRASDIDVVMVNGYGFPRWRGGPMFMADEIGVKAVLRRIEALAKDDAWFWRPSELLVRLAETNEKLAK